MSTPSDPTATAASDDGGMEPTDAQVEAAYRVLDDEFGIARFAQVRDFINGPDDPAPGPERDAAISRMRAVDEALDAEVRAVVRRALIAAQEVGDGE